MFYFQAKDQNYGTEFWVSDGTSTGTRLFKDILKGPKSSVPYWMSSSSNENIDSIYFSADYNFENLKLGRELWKFGHCNESNNLNPLILSKSYNLERTSGISNKYCNCNIFNQLISTVEFGNNSESNNYFESNIIIDSLNILNYSEKVFEIRNSNSTLDVSAKITLYYSQNDFDKFNNTKDFSKKNLPSNPSENSKISNLRIYKTTNNLNTSVGEVIDPVDSEVVWNETNNRWEISFLFQEYGFFRLTTNLSYISLNINSINSGAWNNPQTWDCNCIPTINDKVIIKTGHRIEVSLGQKAECKSILIEQGAIFDGKPNFVVNPNSN